MSDDVSSNPSSATPADRSAIATEQRHPRSMGLHRGSVTEIVSMIAETDHEVIAAMTAGRAALVALIAAAEPGFVGGGRLVYYGAGTSGRLGVLDASEAPPTFCVEPGRVVGIIAGGDASLRTSSEGKEDAWDGAWDALRSLDLTGRDTVIGIAAGGTTPYVLGGFEFLKSLTSPPVTGMITCSPIDQPDGCDYLVVLPTGPEIITGSTRMKAGTATKLALNTISTTLMVRAGRVYDNLMIDVRPTNDKLRDRAARIIMTLSGVSRDRAHQILAACGGDIRRAIVVARVGCTPSEAVDRVAAVGGIHRWLDEMTPEGDE